MDIDTSSRLQHENNKEFGDEVGSNFVAMSSQGEGRGRGSWWVKQEDQEQRTDGANTHTHTQEYDTRGRGRGSHVTSSLAASTSTSTIVAANQRASVSPIPPHIPIAVEPERKRLSIGDLVNPTPANSNGSASASASASVRRPITPGGSPPVYWPSTSTSTVTNGASSAEHSPVPFPTPAPGPGSGPPPLYSRRSAPSKRPPAPIPTTAPGSASVSTSSPLRHSARYSPRASPYPTSASANPLGVGTGIMNGSSSNSGVAVAIPSPVPAPVSPNMLNDQTAAAANIGLTSPSGSMSTTRRRGAPQFPSPKKEVRSYSFNSIGGGSSATAQTPRDWYLKTPTALRVPPTAQILSPTPIGGSSTRRPGPPGAGGASNSAPAVAQARRVHLTDVPKAKLVETLNSKAGEYWFRPETSDCRIYVPMPKRKTPDSDSPDSATATAPTRPIVHPPVVATADETRPNVVSAHGQASGLGRRGSEPGDQALAHAQLDVHALVFPLHRDYLIIQSNLLRALLSSGSSLDVTLRTSPTRPVFPGSPSPGAGPGPGSATPSSRSFPTPRPSAAPRTLKGARVLPNATPPHPQGSGGPVPISVYLPLPDPASFGVILHWLYWGDTATLERSLSRGSVTWQGIVKNIEYLSLDDSIKRVMGKWWRTWVKTDVGRGQYASDGGGAARKVARAPSSDGDVDESESEADDGMQVDAKGDDDEGVSNLLKNL